MLLDVVGTHVCGRNQSAGEAVVESILGDGGSARFVRVDVSVEDEVRRLVAGAVSGCGGIDVLVNNAMAIDFIGAGGERPIVDQPTESFDYIVKVGLYGTFWATKYAIPAMLEGTGTFPTSKHLFNACTSRCYARHPMPDPSRWVAITDPDERQRLDRDR
jgi:NAD(P)-dependent dehydrogenase (short-subunit alcohol dehydrogenase family)